MPGGAMNVRPQFPLVLNLPGGRATLVGSTLGGGVPCYEYDDGTQIALDTHIPEDLAGRWFWAAPIGLGLIVPPGECGYTIASVSYPPPGVEAPFGRNCYEVAREYEAREQALAAPRQVKQPKPKRKTQPVQAQAMRVEQAVMEL